MRVINMLNSPWAILQSTFEKLVEVHGQRMLSESAGTLSAISPRGAAEGKPYEVANGVALIPIEGVLTKRADFWTWLFGGTSTELVGRIFQTALADTDVQAILLQVDSPGGEVDGTQELARQVREARGTKPIYTLASSLMASAAYWIGSAADRIFITGDTTRVGSIGVIGTHYDLTKRAELLGVKVTHIVAGKYKAIGSPFRPLDRASEDYLQAQVDFLYSAFVNDVARNRRVSADKVLTEMADARIFLGHQAVDAGLVDGFATQEQLIGDLTKQGVRPPIAPAAKTSRQEDTMELTQEQLAAARALLQKEFEAARQDAEAKAQAGLEAKLASARADGAKTERERIQGIEAIALPGHEALVQQLKFDGKTTPGEASQQVLAAEKAHRERRLKALKTDAGPALEDAGAPPEKPAGAVDPNLPLEERCKQEWERNVGGVRDEFTRLEAYVAFKKAEAQGRVRVFSRPAERSA